MNVADILIVILLVGAAVLGFRYGVLKQVVVSIGTVVGLFAVAFLYNKLAFLAERSGMRAIILALMLFAVLFLLYDISLKLGERLRRRLRSRLKRQLLRRIERASGAVIGVVASVFTIWLAASLFSGSALPVVRQLEGSLLLATVDRIAETPVIFKNAAHLLEPFSPPEAFVGAEPEFSQASSAVLTQEFTKLDKAMETVRPAVVKINSWGCGTRTVGSGFLIGKKLVATNAHVVAGVDRMSIQDESGTFVAQAIWFDPRLDLAILVTEAELAGAPLVLQAKTLTAGSIAAVMGYPNGTYSSGDATVLQAFTAEGLDIYGKLRVIRNLYALRGAVVPGNSGGPLINSNGEAVGMVIGHSTTHEKTGYAISAEQIAAGWRNAQAQNRIVDTGSCVGG